MKLFFSNKWQQTSQIHLIPTQIAIQLKEFVCPPKTTLKLQAKNSAKISVCFGVVQSEDFPTLA